MNGGNNVRDMKGQGALEYLLLIGGAVLVAAIVIVLLLGINQSSGGTTSATSAATLCTQKLGAKGTTTAGLACNDSTNGITGAARPCLGGYYYDCGGTYPSCTGTKTSATC